MVGYRAALVIAALSVAAQRPSADGRAGGIVEDRAALLAFWRHADNARVRDGRRTIMNTYGSIVLGGWSDELNEDGGMVSEPCGAGSHDNPQTGWLGLMCDGIAELCFESCSQTATGRNCRGGCSDSCACDRSRFCCTTWTGACDSCQDGRGNAFGCGAGDCTSSPYGPGEGGRVVYVGLEGGRGISGDVATFASMGALQWLVLNANSGVYGDVASLSGLSELRMLNLRDTSVHGSVGSLASLGLLGQQFMTRSSSSGEEAASEYSTGLWLSNTDVFGPVDLLREIPGLGESWGSESWDYTACSTYSGDCEESGLSGGGGPSAAAVAGRDECACCGDVAMAPGTTVDTVTGLGFLIIEASSSTDEIEGETIGGCIAPPPEPEPEPCDEGWAGRWCSDDMDECASGPCRNGALCADSTSSDAAVPAPANTSVKTAETSAIRVS